MRYEDGIELIEKYYQETILNNSMLNDVLKSMDNQSDYIHLKSHGEHLIYLLNMEKNNVV